MRNIIRRKQTGMAMTTVWDMQRQGLYPKFFKITTRSAGLYEDEHDRVIKLRALGAPDVQIKSLVSRIHQERIDAGNKLLADLS
jgi:predicted DNA-binding transcriptional regulator AlpA